MILMVALFFSGLTSFDSIFLLFLLEKSCKILSKAFLKYYEPCLRNSMCL